ncbi:uncharacterized protein LOC124410956 [Diprion similis]|uniref:uncharacterized protein LOC124410956 n=1 Tax=Diprion similis TaxID=362088 RepID=UPI001EF82E60|nr:uncharacterized protein LOC124410956 [Diprion similis]
MLKKALSKSGLRILRALKKLSTKSRLVKKSQSSATSKLSLGSANSRPSTLPEHEAISLSWSLASLDTKSVDTYLTMVSENVPESPENYSKKNRCCCCAEYEENLRNENRENEMFV